MGTNFYGKRDGKEVHIGKRSAAGAYCCGQTLCKEGVEGIHKGRSEWYDACPNCGMAKPLCPCCCSFTWAIPPYEIGLLSRIHSEYDQPFTVEEFSRELREYPFHFYELIGHDFS